MSIPKTPVEFDYDLWTTEEGKCMVRIKATGEITEVERSVMQVLRSEEKRLRRTISPEQGPSREGKTAPTVLSLDMIEELTRLKKLLEEFEEPLDRFDEKLFTEIVQAISISRRDEMTVTLIGGLRFTEML